ncbi:sacsin N-terminal ATP-binding-like domain-containing protein [Coleofasciculus sp. G2-EDA-02]|uniref:sacsin N-terminal ATP-binding-like domain-containing protein n=1 Tax=Coleofasciculus sp. G2-EDA-02 TaxID=3069529 RepID=UPI0032FB6E27
MIAVEHLPDNTPGIITLGEGEAWYQSEPLTTRLKNLIRDYPEGVGIIKELIQNADDAGATRVEIIFDWRTHSFEQLPDPRMEALMGASMLVYNDSKFTDEDFKNIKSLGDSGKRETLWKTGRFGVGFNSVYHVTDHPSFISRDRIVFFDPHASAIPGATLGQPGHSWRFEDGWWGYPDFMKVYEPGGLRAGITHFDGTLFRLPLRNVAQAKQSKIRNEPFSQENVRQLLAEFVKAGEEMLLFLKSVLTIQVCEIDSDGSKRDLLAIATQNDQAVKIERRKLLTQLQKGADTLLTLCQSASNDLPAVCYRHTIKVATPENQTISTWRVTSLIRAEGELLSLMQEMAAQGEKAVPWAGAAALISRTGNTQQKTFVGRAYCFLPLPQETGLPVHINGFFDLDSSRRELTSDSLTGRDKKRVLWNQLLVRHVLSHAYANLIVSLVEDIGETEPERFYQFFPPERTTKALAELPTYVIKLLQSKRVIRSAIGHPTVIQQNGRRQVGKTHWVTPQTIKILPQGWESLLDPLRLDGIDLPDPTLPPELEAAFSRADTPLTVFKPIDLRSRLLMKEPLGMPVAKAPKACLRKREWVTNLLRYCLSDGRRDVKDLPLAILADGTLQSFGHNPPGFIYILNSHERQILMDHIFASRPDWFLDEDFADRVREISQCQGQGISILTPVEVAKRLKDLIDLGDYIAVEWEPDGEQIPNSSWLTQVYNFFADVKNLPTNEIKEVPLVPCNDGLLYIGGTAETPLWYGSSTSRETLDTLKYFEIPLVEAQEPLQRAIATFRSRHSDQLIWRLTVPDLIDTLYAKGELPVYNPDYYKGLVSFLADRNWIQGEGKNDEPRKKKLRQLQIYPTIEGQLTELNNVYAPGGYVPPKVAGSLKLLCLGANENSQEWKAFYDFLGVPVLDHTTMIQNLLADYANLKPNQQLEALEWIRDHLSIAQTELEKRSQSVDLKKRVREAPLIRCTDGQLRATSAIYSPKTYNEVRLVLGERAHTPDMGIYKNAEHWLDFFRELRMLETPSANDLLTYVDEQIQQAKNGVTDAISKHLTDVFSHLEKHWERLEKEKVSTGKTLAEALKTRAWLPVERDPEKLKRFPAFTVPQNRLYRSDEVCFSPYGFLVASQKPLFVVGKLPKNEFQQALGFRFPNREDVVNHFKALIQLWDGEATPSFDDEAFQRSLQNIYNYFNTAFLSSRATDADRQWLRNQLQGYKCLWNYGEFWKPEHTFQVNVPFFGKRRQRITPSSPIREVYELLGQKRQPGIDDYLAFLAQLAKECRGEPLDADDAKCAYEVLQLLTRDLELEQRSAADYDLLLLTDDNLLLPPNQILIPDAPWRLNAIADRNQVKILHPEVPHTLASTAGSRSLLSDVIEKPTNIDLTNDQNANRLCQKWRNLLRSPEFLRGLERLIVDQYGLEAKVELDWLARAGVVAAGTITTKLLLDDHCIASGLQGSYYFEPNKCVFYLSYEGEELMRHHQTESLNHQLGSFKLNDTARLLTMFNSQPSEIEHLLDRLKVKALKRAALVTVPFDETDGDEVDQIFDTDLLDEFGTDSMDEDKTKDGNEQKPASPSLVTSTNGNALEQANTKPNSAPPTNNDSAVISPPVPFTPVQPAANPIIKPAKSVARTTYPSQQYRNGVRVRSGLEVEPNKSVEAELSEAEGKKIDRAGMAQVMEYERRHGREPKDMNEIHPNHPGYDIESRDVRSGEVRYIEVKSLRGLWDRRGVCMSLTQFEKGNEKQDEFWLYVVEQAEMDEAKVTPIQNPVGLVGEFYYDDSWRQLADDEASEVG